jgi:tRNA(Ile)-lysidine synthase
MLYERVARFITQHNLITAGQKIVIGLSGGPDSLFLLHFLKWLQQHISFTMVAAHLDHEWRKDSARDVLFCERICRSYEIPFIGARASSLPITIKKTRSKEDQGRQMRRAFLTYVKEAHKADRIALAHHQDDQVETFFIRLARGTSVSGLACMRPQHDAYIRPLLTITKQDILAYLNEHNITYLEDPTNILPTFLRNRIRLELIPLLNTIDNRFEKNIIKTIDNLRDADTLLRSIAQHTLAHISTIKNNTRVITTSKFLAHDTTLQKYMILELLYETHAPFAASTGLINELLRFLAHKKHTTHTIDTWHIIKKRGHFSLHNTMAHDQHSHTSKP